MIHPPRKRHHRTVSAILLLGALLISPIAAHCDDLAEASFAQPAATGNISVDAEESFVTTAPDGPAQLRGSLSMRAAPMSQIFTLLGAMTPLRFRYASPPDAVLTAEWKDALLLPSLEQTLRAAQWQMHREGVNVFVFPFTEQRTDANSAPQGWQYWNNASPPPRRWMAMDAIKPPKAVQIRTPVPPTRAQQTAPSGSVRKQPDRNSGSNRIVVRWRTEPTAATSVAWSNARLNIDASQRPGVQVFAPQAIPSLSVKAGGGEAVSGSAATTDTSVWLRWRLPLHFVPRGGRLLLETPVAATLYVNGAPLLSHRSGINTIDLSRVLLVGENYLALHLANVPPELRAARTAGANKDVSAVADAAHEPGPLFRYEWIFDGAFNGSETDSTTD
ncbi:MAG TPA: hypothetical protein VF600_01315 [Abditibacteriaceae bacterium]|jgi:hypothetical protein